VIAKGRIVRVLGHLCARVQRQQYCRKDAELPP
jgi:hypothetical protein